MESHLVMLLAIDMLLLVRAHHLNVLGLAGAATHTGDTSSQPDGKSETCADCGVGEPLRPS